MKGLEFNSGLGEKDLIKLGAEITPDGGVRIGEDQIITEEPKTQEYLINENKELRGKIIDLEKKLSIEKLKNTPWWKRYKGEFLVEDYTDVDVLIKDYGMTNIKKINNIDNIIKRDPEDIAKLFPFLPRGNEHKTALRIKGYLDTKSDLDKWLKEKGRLDEIVEL
ncbi:MAG: hypothetical protein WC662_02180 [Candidatus Paceibacterota bacterium]|jgi:hypothetical protein